MKRFIILLLLIPGLLSAQRRQVVATNSGEDLSQKVSTHIQYLFPEFTNGDVYQRGTRSSGKLNYNMLLGEMQFLENNQVMSLANSRDVLVVNIDNRVFYPLNDKEFTEMLLTTGDHQLRVRRRGNVASHAKKGAYGTTSSTSAITSYTSIERDNRTHSLSVFEEVLVTVNYFYYLVGPNGKYVQIKNVRSFTKQFPAFRSQIEAFARENNIRFNDEDDLKKLLKFCSGLMN